MNYAKSTLLLGFVVPIVIAGILFSVGWYGFSWVNGVHEERAAAYAQLQRDRTEVSQLQAEVLPKKGSIAYFGGLKREKGEEKLPPFVSDLCDGEFSGFIVRNSLEFGAGDNSVTLNLTGRYDSLQKMLAKIAGRFLFLRTDAMSFTRSEADMNFPSRYLTLNYSGKIDNGVTGQGGVTEGSSGGVPQ